LGLAISKNQEIGSDISFKNCLLRTETDMTDLATGCIYPEKPNFLKLGTEEDKYIFDYRIDSVSSARGNADRAYSVLFPYDMNGVSRTSDDGPSLVISL